jgi:putative ATPase
MDFTPLAARVRPQSLDDYIGQHHLVGENGILRKSMAIGQLPSLIFWGKTSLARILAQQQERPFYELSAINAGVKEVRAVIDKAKNSGGLFSGKKPLLFIDEIHRFSKAQQDALLGAVEQGLITLIGATTENPSFEVINALRSRCQVYTLNALSKEELLQVLERALKVDTQLQQLPIVVKEHEALLQLSGGDARKLLTVLELVVQQQQDKNPIVLTNATVQEVVQTNLAQFDKNGDLHYDIASAFIKSLRGSDPNAAVYWLARMLEGGEDLKFIARRMLIFASEDIGNANPNALLLAQSCFQAATVVGFPEARIILGQCATYLACSPKSNAAYKAIDAAIAAVRATPDAPVPLHLRNAPTELMKDLHYGEGYQYPHDFPQHFTPQEYLPTALSGTVFYTPAQNPTEDRLRAYLKALWKEKYNY